MLGAITVLLVFQTIGEVVVQLLRLPVPGPVVGMMLLFAALLARGAAPQWLERSAGQLLAHLSLLFVPAGVGVMLHGQRLGAEWLPIAVALVSSTLLTLAATALVMQALRRMVGGRDAPE